MIIIYLETSFAVSTPCNGEVVQWETNGNSVPMAHGTQVETHPYPIQVFKEVIRGVILPCLWRHRAGICARHGHVGEIAQHDLENARHLPLLCSSMMCTHAMNLLVN